jgi:virginiamycin A acetyltransferase
MRTFLKRVAQSIALFFAFPFALLTIFGHLQPVFTVFAQLLALGPGLPGDYMRSAYYKLTLRRCFADTRIGFGTYFVRRESVVGKQVSIGGYCVIGGVTIGMGTQIGSHVLIPGGRHQHCRDANGNLESTRCEEIIIGDECWIGDGSILMADIGEHSTIGAGAVVTNPIPPGVVAVGNPARPLNRGMQLEA